MFLPGRNVEEERLEKQRVFKRVEELATSLLPESMRPQCDVSVQEVQCGDPQCAPIDTIITLMFESGGQGIFGVPAEAKDVSLEELQQVFPPEEILDKWHKGEDAEWPPLSEEPMQLRFDIGSEVLCRVGATEWAPGRVAELWYREPNWPEGAFAPYKIKLDDGRDIFAPADVDQVIRPNPNPADRSVS